MHILLHQDTHFNTYSICRFQDALFRKQVSCLNAHFRAHIPGLTLNSNQVTDFRTHIQRLQALMPFRQTATPQFQDTLFKTHISQPGRTFQDTHFRTHISDIHFRTHNTHFRTHISGCSPSKDTHFRTHIAGRTFQDVRTVLDAFHDDRLHF